MYQGQIIKAKDIELLQKQEQQTSRQENISQTATNKDEIKITLEEARNLADKIKQKAFEEAREIHNNIVEQAYENAKIITFEKATQLAKIFDEDMKNCEGELGRIIADCVRKIIGQLPKKQIFRSIIKTALEEYRSKHAISIRISANDFDNAWWENWDYFKKNNIDVSIFEKDNSLKEGQYIIDFGDKEIDVGLITQLTNLEKFAAQPLDLLAKIKDKRV